jgi:hypothetical protein
MGKIVKIKFVLLASLFSISSIQTASAGRLDCSCIKEHIINGALEHFLQESARVTITNHPFTRTCISTGNSINRFMTRKLGVPERGNNEGRLINNPRREDWDTKDLSDCLVDQGHLEVKVMKAKTKKHTQAIKFMEFFVTMAAQEALMVEKMALVAGKYISNFAEIGAKGTSAMNFLIKAGFMANHANHVDHIVEGDDVETMKMLSHAIIDEGKIHCMKYVQDDTIISSISIKQSDLEAYGLCFTN